MGFSGKEQSGGATGMRSISLLAGQRPTKATMDRGSERKAPHIGTETRPKLLREAAVNWSMGGSLNQPSSVDDEGPTGRKVLLRGNKGRHAWRVACTARISIG